MPRAVELRNELADGRAIPVGLVTWLTRTSVSAASPRRGSRSSASSGPPIGKGIRATTTVAPSRPATDRSALIVALYS